MKSSLVRLICFVLCFCCIRAEEAPKEVAETWEAQLKARSAFYDQMRVAQRDYRRRLSEIILKADKIEVFLLDFTIPEVESDAVTGIETFPIVPYSKDTRIIKKAVLGQGDLQAFKEAVVSALTGEENEGGVMCHYPIHGIKIFRSNEPVFQTSLCWACGNYYVEYPNGASWDQMTMGFGQLKDLLDKHMPIPPEEMEKFRRKTGSPKKKNQPSDNAK